MDRTGRYLLVAPPLPPLAVAAGETIVIGRGATCDLVLASPAASRRHAEVVGQPAGWRVRDLGSTNGTFLNGERVEAERELHAGDAIQIGEQTIHFCHVESGEAEAGAQGGERTMLLAAPAGEGMLRGSLAEIPPIGLLQLLELERKSGVLEIETGAGKARLWIDEGRPVHAELADAAGLEAALQIAVLRSGRFVLAAEASPPERSIEIPMMELVLEASRRFDESV
jgi:pSer/pThr/pTyr-binding forkhead associated (FHA) protein